MARSTFTWWLFLSALAYAQSTQNLTFEVASVKPSPPVWTGWSHVMTNHLDHSVDRGRDRQDLPAADGHQGPGSIERHGGYEDVYVKTAMGWRIKSRTHVRDRAWFNPLLQTPDLN